MITSQPSDYLIMLHLEKFHFKNQHCLWRDRPWHSIVAISKVRPDAEPPLAADEHSFDAILKACDDIALAEREGRFCALTNLVTLVQEKLIANGDHVAAISHSAASQRLSFDLDPFSHERILTRESFLPADLFFWRPCL